jgi:hypothetical protein
MKSRRATMRSSRAKPNRWIAKVSLAAVTLSGCGGAYEPLSTEAPASITLRSGGSTRASWMDRSAKGSDLLYVSNVGDFENGSVYVYAYPQGHLVGTLTGFFQPFGECVDTAGDIYIVDYPSESSGGSTIYEYAHGGTSPIATLNDPSAAFGCAVDPRSGNLAVSGAGVAVYKHASGNPIMHYWSESYFFYCGYDSRGDLYLSAPNEQYLDQVVLVRLNKSGTFQSISIAATLLYSSGPFILYPSVQSVGTDLAMSSAPARPGDPLTVYRLHINGDQALIRGTTLLSTTKDVFGGQFWIQGGAIVGSNAGTGDWNVSLWRYPLGGKVRKTIATVKRRELPHLEGAAVSQAAQPRRGSRLTVPSPNSPLGRRPRP